jgi:uncharacterized membrane protein YccC
MTTVVHRSPRKVTGNRLQQVTSLLAQAARRVRRRGRAGDEELAQRLERCLLSFWAGDAEAEVALLAVLADVRETCGRRSR